MYVGIRIKVLPMNILTDMNVRTSEIGPFCMYKIAGHSCAYGVLNVRPLVIVTYIDSCRTDIGRRV